MHGYNEDEEEAEGNEARDDENQGHWVCGSKLTSDITVSVVCGLDMFLFYFICTMQYINIKLNLVWEVLLFWILSLFYL